MRGSPKFGRRRESTIGGGPREIANIRLDHGVAAEAGVLARVLGVSFSELVERALVNELKALEQGPDEVRRAFAALKSLDAAKPREVRA